MTINIRSHQGGQIRDLTGDLLLETAIAVQAVKALTPNTCANVSATARIEDANWLDESGLYPICGGLLPHATGVGNCQQSNTYKGSVLRVSRSSVEDVLLTTMATRQNTGGHKFPAYLCSSASY